MEKKIGLLLIIAATILVLGMYIGIGIYANNWLPKGWLLGAMIVDGALWGGYWLGRGDSK